MYLVDKKISHWESTIQVGLYNGALTEQFSDLKSFHIGAKIGDLNYTLGVEFLDHDLL